MRFPAFYPVSNLCFTAGNRTSVQNCHAAPRQLKSAICTSVVHGRDNISFYHWQLRSWRRPGAQRRRRATTKTRAALRLRAARTRSWARRSTTRPPCSPPSRPGSCPTRWTRSTNDSRVSHLFRIKPLTSKFGYYGAFGLLSWRRLLSYKNENNAASIEKLQLCKLRFILFLHISPKEARIMGNIYVQSFLNVQSERLWRWTPKWFSAQSWKIRCFADHAPHVGKQIPSSWARFFFRMFVGVAPGIFSTDYICWEGKKSWRVKRRHWCHLISLDSLFQKTPMFTSKKQTVKPGDAFENIAFERWFEIVKS